MILEGRDKLAYLLITSEIENNLLKAQKWIHTLSEKEVENDALKKYFEEQNKQIEEWLKQFYEKKTLEEEKQDDKTDRPTPTN